MIFYWLFTLLLLNTQFLLNNYFYRIYYVPDIFLSVPLTLIHLIFIKISWGKYYIQFVEEQNEIKRH